jgi:class 3 adenylate cyclase
MKDQRRILAVIAISNIVGAFFIFFYFAYIDLETFYANKAFWRGSQVDWTTFAVIMLFLALISVVVGWRISIPLVQWQIRLHKGEAAAAMPMNLQRRALSFPLIAALISLAGWLIAGLFFGQGGVMFFTADAFTFARTFLGVGIVGGLTVSSLVFLTADALWRDHLPTFFPAGDFAKLKVRRVSVGQRLVATFLLTGLMPLVILAMVTRNGVLNAMEANLDPAAVLTRVTLTVLFIVTLTFVTNVLLILLTTRSLLRPLHRLTAAMKIVATGDLTPRLTVDSNDELGDLGYRFNLMLDELVQSQRMRDLFGRYVSKEVAEQVLKNGADLGGENVPATALFADIRDFTTLTESLPPQQVVGILNRYYSRMVDAIVEQGGWVNKFGGDSLLAVFGAPIRQSDHALRAVNAAWAMNHALAEFNAEQIALGLQPITIGIGISSGEMVAGNVGGKERLEYTVIGDPVNLAARLESLTKEWQTAVLLSEYTNDLLIGDTTETHARDRVTVKGKTQSTLVYELRGVAG